LHEEAATYIRRLRNALADAAQTGCQMSSELDEQAEETRRWCDRLSGELRGAGAIAEGLLADCDALGQQSEAYLQAMDFRFLYDPQRHVFHLGYHVEAEKLDPNHYDLLASEARLASVLAIAKGDVPQNHWLHLARPITTVDGMRPLLSWNGSMFEYLMPSLVMRTYEHTLLDQTCRDVVRAQIEYGRHKGVPWGISEAGYYAFDADMNYQYRGFGVPGLGFKRGLADDLVISPYASLLAISVAPEEVTQNVDYLAA